MDNRPKPRPRPVVASRKAPSAPMLVALVVLSIAGFAVGYLIGRNKSQKDVKATLFVRALGSIHNSGTTLQMLEGERDEEIKRFQEAILKRAATDAQATKAFLDRSRFDVAKNIESCGRAQDYAQRQGMSPTEQELRDVCATLGAP